MLFVNRLKNCRCQLTNETGSRTGCSRNTVASDTSASLPSVLPLAARLVATLALRHAARSLVVLDHAVLNREVHHHVVYLVAIRPPVHGHAVPPAVHPAALPLVHRLAFQIVALYLAARHLIHLAARRHPVRRAALDPFAPDLAALLAALSTLLLAPPL